jgi:hypothetical protein
VVPSSSSVVGEYSIYNNQALSIHSDMLQVLSDMLQVLTYNMKGYSALHPFSFARSMQFCSLTSSLSIH